MKIVVEIKSKNPIGEDISDRSIMKVLEKITGSGSVMLVSGYVHGGLVVEVTGVVIDDPVTVGGTPMYEIDPL